MCHYYHCYNKLLVLSWLSSFTDIYCSFFRRLYYTIESKTLKSLLFILNFSGTLWMQQSTFKSYLRSNSFFINFQPFHVKSDFSLHFYETTVVGFIETKLYGFWPLVVKHFCFKEILKIIFISKTNKHDNDPNLPLEFVVSGNYHARFIKVVLLSSWFPAAELLEKTNILKNYFISISCTFCINNHGNVQKE